MWLVKNICKWTTIFFLDEKEKTFDIYKVQFGNIW